MRKGWLVLAVSAGVTGAFAFGTQSSQAAMIIKHGEKNMSLVETVAKKSKKQCTTYLLWECCTEKGKAETCSMKKM